MKLSAEYHQREVSILQARIAEEIEDWCLKLSIERQRVRRPCIAVILTANKIQACNPLCRSLYTLEGRDGFQ